MAAADVVVSKPGYGIVSECVANGTALRVHDAGTLRRVRRLVAEMPRVLRCHNLPPDDLVAGRWSGAIAAVLAQPAPPERWAPMAPTSRLMR